MVLYVATGSYRNREHEEKMNINTLAKKFNAYTTVDRSSFQRRARVLQSIWREEQGLHCGTHRGVPLGSRLPMPDARETLADYLTDTIRNIVRNEVIDKKETHGKLYGATRIFNDLLSSLPLCFNLFGELGFDLKLASSVI
jgi:hypothetical protein